MIGMKNKVVTFGDLMLRLSPPGFKRFVQADNFDATYTGAEANVAVSLANYGLDSYFVTKVPDHEIGQAAINHLRKYGVNTDYIVRGGERLGLFYLEMGASQRPSKVIYDRRDSAICNIDANELDWDRIMDGACWFHFTGITPALDDRLGDILFAAVTVAKAKGLKVSADLNYRRKLWAPEKANQVMSRLMEYVDIAIGNEEDAEKVFGIKAANSNVIAGKLDETGYYEVAKQLADRFGLEKVAITMRESLSASDNNWSAMLYDRENFYHSRVYKVHIVDRVGGGDSFAGGLIYALSAGRSSAEALEFATAASCLKQTIFWDFNLVSAAEVENLLKGDASGRIQR
jgi:2-dehydro-3-deoxygluconokinase